MTVEPSCPGETYSSWAKKSIKTAQPINRSKQGRTQGIKEVCANNFLTPDLIFKLSISKSGGGPRVEVWP